MENVPRCTRRKATNSFDLLVNRNLLNNKCLPNSEASKTFHNRHGFYQSKNKASDRYIHIAVTASVSNTIFRENLYSARPILQPVLKFYQYLSLSLENIQILNVLKYQLGIVSNNQIEVTSSYSRENQFMKLPIGSVIRNMISVALYKVKNSEVSLPSDGTITSHVSCTPKDKNSEQV